MSEITRGELIILDNGHGARIKSLANFLNSKEEIDFPSINTPITLVSYLETRFSDVNFNRSGSPYVTEGQPEKIHKVQMTFNQTTFKITAAMIGKGTDVNGVVTWFTEDNTENGKPSNEALLNWLDANL